MKTKICFKCGVEKEFSKFYKHPQMGDGHLNKCKECTKTDVKNTYLINVEDIKYVQKERLRSREKYSRLKHKMKPMAHPETKTVSKSLRSRGVDLIGKEIHHWDYNSLLDVFLLNPRAHKLVHKYLKFHEETKMFTSVIDGQLLDTKQKHYELIMQVFSLNTVNYEIETYV